MKKYSELSTDEKREYSRTAQARYREKNHDAILERRRLQYANNADAARKRSVENYDPDRARKYYLANKERISAVGKAYRKANPEAHAARSKAWFEANKERRHELGKIWQSANKVRITATRHARMWALKLEVWLHYGGASCACCGEAHKEFLTIDHINGGGAKHRAEIRANGSQHIYQWLKKHDYPAGYRVLCMNCNWATGLFGGCPHAL